MTARAWARRGAASILTLGVAALLAAAATGAGTAFHWRFSAANPARGARTVVVEKFENGFVRREASYRDGVLDGPVRGWYDDGTRAYLYHYENGVSEGTQEQWFRDGAPLTLFHHHEGHELGQQQMWNADGTIRSNYVIKDGRRYGLLGTMGCSGKDSVAIAAARAGM